MDFESLKNQVSNITLYDLKAGFRKAQNAVMNYTEMESKVREATNNEPWGASTTMMQEIASGTFNYATLNEIMPMIYKRFTEKSAEEWRQIYKALQLLEFLIKNGSERVIDDARSHVSLLKMLRQFHYIDLNGKDQGINVRNRAKELAEMLSDVEKIRTERKKARSNRNKYGGVEGGAGATMGGAGAPRYGGFGSESAGDASTYGGYSGGVYGDGGGFGGAGGDQYGDTQGRRERFEEYDEYDEGAVASPVSKSASKATAASSKPAPKVEAVKPKPKEPEVDLFDFSEDTLSMPAISNGKQTTAGPTTDYGMMQSAAADEDDFDDFQSAAPAVSSPTFAAPPRASTVSSATQFASPAPMAPQTQSSFAGNMYSTISPPPASTAAPNYSAFTSPPPATSTFQQPSAAPTFSQSQQAQSARPTGYQGAQPNYYGSITATSASPAPTGNQQQRSSYTSPLGGSKPAAKSASGTDPFATLSLGGLGGKKASGMQAKGPTMADLNKEKATAGIWGASPSPMGTSRPMQTQPQTQYQGQSQGGSAGDLLGL